MRVCVSFVVAAILGVSTVCVLSQAPGTAVDSSETKVLDSLQGSPSQSQASHLSTSTLPQVARICIFFCFTLRWDGSQYIALMDGRTDGKPSSIYSVREFTASSVILDRKDDSGLTHVLTGRISRAGNSIVDGIMAQRDVHGVDTVYPFQMGWGSALLSPINLGSWTGIGEAVRPLDAFIDKPQVIHFCAFNCFTLRWNGKYYIADPAADDPPGHQRIWELKRFTPPNMEIYRHESPSPQFPRGYRALYAGQISSDGTRLINVTIDGKPTTDHKFTWGVALSLLPGSNAERDKLAQAQRAPSNGSDAAVLGFLGLVVGAVILGEIDEEAAGAPNTSINSLETARTYCSPDSGQCVWSRPSNASSGYVEKQ